MCYANYNYLSGGIYYGFKYFAFSKFDKNMMIETDNKYTREDIKNSLLDLIARELEGYEVSLLYRDTKKE